MAEGGIKLKKIIKIDQASPQNKPGVGARVIKVKPSNENIMLIPVLSNGFNQSCCFELYLALY